jgi:hypothetical protein
MSNITNQLRGYRKLHPTEANMTGTKNKLVGHNKEINAYDKAQLLANIADMFKQMSSGQIMQASEQSTTSNLQAKKERREALAAAYEDPGKFKALGAAIANELSVTANRDGFLRRLMQEFDVTLGNVPRIRINYKTQFGVVASGPSQVRPIMIRNKFIYPPEFFVQTSLLVDEREIAQSPGDILEEKLIEGNEAIMVQEDRTAKRLWDNLVGVSNPLITLMSSFTPQTLQSMRSTLLVNNLPPDTVLFAADVWDDLLTNSSFTSFYDPVSEYEIVQTGVIGRILGMNLLSDSYRIPQLQVLNQGEIYVFPRPEFLGGYTSRGPVQANEVNGTTNGQGIPARGWFCFEIMSMTAPIPQSVVKAVKTSF